MDLISMLIQTKERPAIDLTAWLKELVKYEQLSKAPKFQHLLTSKFLQTQLPLCTTAFFDDPEAYFMCQELGQIIQQTTGQPLILLDDLKMHYSKKRLKQLQIIGQSQPLHFYYADLRMLPSDLIDKTPQVWYLTQYVDTNTLSLSVLAVDPNQKDKIDVYTGTLKINGTDYNVTDGKIAPYVVDLKDHDQLRILSYSVMGNNDYNFASTNHYRIAMPNNHQFRFKNVNDQTVALVNITDDDVRNFALKRQDIAELAQLIIKYLPKGA